ncbi:hypothetical protein POTOM_018326 [Populus tomentosa]|uniref:ZNF598/HEL2 PAH domain-containing protein n=1 Tax=Populus tomentosa TaxID=118781 RepID=A0A8X7ZPD2_POPTO|nr:hypothetical protein POTOM_018326 [Populus tomentosa]
MDDTCAVCADTLEWVAYGPYLHKEVCFTCIIRLRFICNDFHCCICKSESNTIFVTKALGDYTRMISDFKGRKIFTSEQKLYNRAQLTQHVRTGDSVVDGSESERGGFTGHPICEFCENPFYGDNELYLHLSTEHFTCHICPRQHPEQYEYFNSYDNSEVDYILFSYILLAYEACLAKRFIVFAIESELKRHNAMEHGGCLSCSKRTAVLQIPTSFRFQQINEHYRHGRSYGSRLNSSSYQMNLAIVDSHLTANAEKPCDISLNECTNGRNLFSFTSDGSKQQPTEIQKWSGWVELEYNGYSPSFLKYDSRVLSPSSSLSSSQSKPATIKEYDLSTYTSFAQARPSRTNGLVSSDFASSSRTSNSNSKVSQATVAPNPVDRTSHKSLSSAPSLSTAQVDNMSISASHFLTVEYVQSSNKALVEKIRAAFEFHEEKFSAFKLISREYLRDLIDTAEYLACVHQFGLSHLVLELARLCPSAEKQRELVETYNYNVGKEWFCSLKVEILPKEGHHGGKGKSKILVDKQTNLNLSMEPKSEIVAQPDGVSSKKNVGAGGGGNKPKKKTSKFLKNRVSDSSAASLPNVGNSDADMKKKRKQI